MKILLATGVYPPESGGPATYSALLEEELPKQGIAVRVLPFREVRHLPVGVRHAAYFFKCVALSRDADVVYAQDTVSVGLPAMVAATVLGKKFMVRVPGDYAWEQGRQRFGVVDDLDAFQKKTYGWRVALLRRVQTAVVRRARTVVVPSEYMKRVVSGWTNAKNITVIYSSVKLPVPYEEPNERPEGFLVVSTGRRVPWKGFEGIARVVAKEKEWHLCIAENMPRAWALGWVKVADVFVLNSTYEGLSHALIEAMSLGTPVVATAVGGNPELIEDGVDGLLVPAGDDGALHAALKRVETDKDSARARAESARIKVERFSVDATIATLTTLLKTL